MSDVTTVNAQNVVENSFLIPLMLKLRRLNNLSQYEQEIKEISVYACMYKKGVIEPLSVKEQAIKSAVESASMILRIDDVISGGKTKAPPAPLGGPGGMPPQY